MLVRQTAIDAARAQTRLDRALRRLEQTFSERTPAAGADTHTLQASPSRLAPARRAPPPLFGSGCDERRVHLRDRLLCLDNGRVVRYRGEALQGDDRAVWQWLLLQQSRYREFAPRTLLKAMGWGSGPRDQRRLRHCLERMQATSLQPLSGTAERCETPYRNPAGGTAVVALSLIDRCEWRPTAGGRGGRWRVAIAADVRALFDAWPYGNGS